ncbi:iron complex transport system substrate-binding protein [Tenacibaculum adriaticum]|uniref:Iron complex transport system substrate-binding protein n=1 Tax=Tenacibaculum adriaticum TaxID=413713 RepID=A0A5S5DTD0_9FLAO|nr:ABC transporter substrate-binding protein [Tenacibaculum adriaticum]TYP99190.1 iron complex transport system substrate-binding protein [Tenacibaculum adriaticum]
MKNRLYFFFGCLFVLVSCKQTPKKEVVTTQTESLVKYAKGFDIQRIGNKTKLIVKNPYLDADETFEYLFSSDDEKGSIKTPVEKLVVTSTTHIPMLELLGGETSLVGFPHPKYVSSVKTRKLIDAGNIKEIGQEANLNTEVLLDLQPELVVAFSMQKTNKSLSLIEQNGIPVLLNGDWLEETPLGRAEWIKFFGVLFNKEQQADSIFKSIEKSYLEAKKIAQKATIKPTVLSGAIMSKDIWNLPAGGSFVAQFLKDANTNYLWKDTEGKGSLSLSFESVLDKAQNADFWIAPGYFNTKEEMHNNNQHYTQFAAFKNDHIYTPNLKKGATGGVVYFELAPTRPDLVLKDIIKITHPELLSNYELSFFEKMK